MTICVIISVIHTQHVRVKVIHINFVKDLKNVKDRPGKSVLRSLCPEMAFKMFLKYLYITVLSILYSILYNTNCKSLKIFTSCKVIRTLQCITFTSPTRMIYYSIITMMNQTGKCCEAISIYF